MLGIDLNQSIIFDKASFRYFDKKDRHTKRFCSVDVLILVFEGILRFSENGVSYEVKEGEYFIQRRDCYQSGEIASDSPKYLYIHFTAQWQESDVEGVLPRRGVFDFDTLYPSMEKLHNYCHNHSILTKQKAEFYKILSALYNDKPTTPPTVADEIEKFLVKNYRQELTLEQLSDEFHFSKNHIIHIFKEKYNMTPFQYVNYLKIRQAELLLEMTSKRLSDISDECGFCDYAHFYKSFMKLHHISPKEWRKKKQYG